MLIPFTKMQALGNDFVVLDGTSYDFQLGAHQTKGIANRRFGIGCDQILLVENCQDPDVDFMYRIFNPDGSEVGQCGNGARAFARYVSDKGLTDKNEIKVRTISGDMLLVLQEDNQVLVNMGAPIWQPVKVPFVADDESDSYSIEFAVNGQTQSIDAGVVSMGNPHVVLNVADVSSAPVESVGPILESHSRFPERVNVGFMQVINPSEINLRVYERGAGETLACGSGACAAVAVGRKLGLLEEQVSVNLPGGQLRIEWQGGDSPILMSGPANYVYEGQFDLSIFN
jgi:diaminopimelate epimerase